MSDDSPPAFPVQTRGTDGHQCGPTVYQFAGMTLRDYFAAKAMQALISRENPEEFAASSWKNYASGAYKAADAMLEARRT